MEYVLNFASIKHEAYCKMCNGLQNELHGLCNGLQNESKKYDAKMTTFISSEYRNTTGHYNALTVIYNPVYMY